MLVSVASAQSEPEAEMICARLSEAGIRAVSKRNIGADNPEFGVGGSRNVYVEEGLAARAREALSVPEFSDAELAKLSEQAGRDAAEAP
jgi:hypothetical protein